MLRKIDIGDEKVAGFRWEGKFDEKALKQGLVQFIPELQSRNRMNIYLEIIDFEGFDPDAIWGDLKYFYKNWNELKNKIDKVSLVTDQSWIKKLAETSSKFIPDIRLKAYNFSEAEAAKSFVKE